MDMFKSELLLLLDSLEQEGNVDDYLPMFRSIGYRRCLSGENPPISALGYLMLCEVYQRVDDEDEFIRIGSYDVQLILNAISQGAALAYYLNDTGRFNAAISTRGETIQLFPKGPDIENNFNCLPMAEVKEHFAKLFNTLSNRKKLLSDEDQERFYSAAFMGHKLDARLNLKGADKQTVRACFHQFYKKCKNHESTSHCKEKYVRLLSDHFLDYPFSTTNNNFRS
jgi:hypothetical protein